MIHKMISSSGNPFPGKKLAMVAGILAGSILSSLLVAQSPASAPASTFSSLQPGCALSAGRAAGNGLARLSDESHFATSGMYYEVSGALANSA